MPGPVAGGASGFWNVVLGPHAHALGSEGPRTAECAEPGATRGGALGGPGPPFRPAWGEGLCARHVAERGTLPDGEFGWGGTSVKA